MLELPTVVFVTAVSTLMCSHKPNMEKLTFSHLVISLARLSYVEVLCNVCIHYKVPQRHMDERLYFYKQFASNCASQTAYQSLNCKLLVMFLNFNAVFGPCCVWGSSLTTRRTCP